MVGVSDLALHTGCRKRTWTWTSETSEGRRKCLIIQYPGLTLRCNTWKLHEWKYSTPSAENLWSVYTVTRSSKASGGFLLSRLTQLHARNPNTVLLRCHSSNIFLSILNDIDHRHDCKYCTRQYSIDVCMVSITLTATNHEYDPTCNDENNTYLSRNILISFFRF